MHETINVKRLKKDGSADKSLYKPVIETLAAGRTAVIPVDGIYGLVAVPGHEPVLPASRDCGSEYLVNDFLMLETRARITKTEYDFLQRIWPDQITVTLKAKTGDLPVCARMPANPVNRDIISGVGGILVYTPLLGHQGKPLCQKSEIDKAVHKICETVLYIDEWCKDHPLPTMIDIQEGKISLLRKGKVSMDEIISLFFLGSMEE